MARIAGVDLPKNKKIGIAMTYIYGVGKATAQEVLTKADVDPAVRTDAVNEDQLARIRAILDQDYRVEGDLRRDISMNIKRLMDLGCFRGIRHRRGLPVRGQRTHTNARTRKGPRKGGIKKK
ncbi:MAG: 30S ribosomal protein S13 [Myxococcota bacterium]